MLSESAGMYCQRVLGCSVRECWDVVSESAGM